MARVSSFRDRGGLFTSLIYSYMYKSYQLITTIITKAIWNCQQKSNNDIHKNTWKITPMRTFCDHNGQYQSFGPITCDLYWMIWVPVWNSWHPDSSFSCILVFLWEILGACAKLRKSTSSIFFFFVVITECLLFILRDIRFKFRLELFGHLCMLY